MKIYADPEFYNDRNFEGRYYRELLIELMIYSREKNLDMTVAASKVNPEKLQSDEYYLTNKDSGEHCYSNVFDLYSEIYKEIKGYDYDQFKDIPLDMNTPTFRNLGDFIGYVGYIKEQNLYPAQAILIHTEDLDDNAKTAFGACCKIENDGSIKLYANPRIYSARVLNEKLYDFDKGKEYMEIYIDKDIYEDEIQNNIYKSLQKYFEEKRDSNKIILIFNETTGYWDKKPENYAEIITMNEDEIRDKKIKEHEACISKENNMNIFKMAMKLDYVANKDIGRYDLRKDLNRISSFVIKNKELVENTNEIKYDDKKSEIIFKDPIDFLCTVQDASTKVNDTCLFVLLEDTQDKEAACTTARVIDNRILIGNDNIEHAKINGYFKEPEMDITPIRTSTLKER